MTDILVIIFILFIFVFIKPLKPGLFDNDCLRMDKAKAMRGTLALVIVLHHISENALVRTPLLIQVNHFGYLCVAMFFFLSGYGLTVRICNSPSDRNEYLSGLWKGRILYMLLIYVLVTLLFIAFKGLLDVEDVSFRAVLNSFKIGNPVASNSWYILVLIVFYIFFWLSFSISSTVGKGIILTSVLVTILNVVFILSPLNWSGFYISSYAFPLGMLWAWKKDFGWQDYAQKHYILVCAVCLALLACFTIIHTSHARMFASCAFCLLLVATMMKFEFRGRLLHFLGEISLEIYLLQAIPMILLRNRYFYVDNDLLWGLMTFVLVVIIAYPAHYVSVVVKKLCRRI